MLLLTGKSLYCFETSYFSTTFSYFPRIARAARSGVTVWEKSWAATAPGPIAVLLCLQELGHARRYLLPPAAFPVSILLIPGSAVSIFSSSVSVLIFKT